MFGWDTYVPGHSPPLDPRLGPDQASEREVRSGRAHTRNEFGNAQGDAIQGAMNMVPSLPTHSYRDHGSPADLHGSFQTGLVGTSEMQGYTGMPNVPSSNTNDANATRMADSVDETLQPKPSGGSNRRRVRNYAVDDTGSVDEDNSSTIRRQRNNIAARRYRQKGRDRIAELESALRVVEEERDRLKLELARKEAEVDALREVLRK
ncbi:Putative CCAAT/enhancer-binding protein C/EBP [Colletotrichum destructivum]|uniref:CCAAT/enhancer-binding protein C/EBP n=1 Tax=Colletotrichum destructivum TaxID=34406 RepID=A0AAX4I0W9_9PEZI|nr:Putative CCAAT/enhancer-binding protein C/EBP [Colletotrichum destructivum]